jgi:hypothetical protein
MRRRIEVMVNAQRLADAKIQSLYDRLDRDAVALAYASRDKWRDALTYVVEQHEPKGRACTCGAAWPCLTIKSLERINPGIARAIEEALVVKDRRDMAQ